MNIEIIVATMNQKDFDLVEKMNIRTSAVIANQNGENSFQEKEYDFGTVKLVSTNTIGVGNNRNIGLLYSSADVLVLADDDMTYVDNLVEIVESVFSNNDVDLVIFNLERDGDKIKKNTGIKKVKLYNSLHYGTARLAVRRNFLDKHNICFSKLYGGGAPYSCGEDSLFIVDCFKKGANVITYGEVIAKLNDSESSWFSGYTEKYFVDKGIWIANSFKIRRKIISLYFSYRYRNANENLKFRDIHKLMKKGMKEYKRL